MQFSETAQDIFETNIVALAAIARANDEGYQSLKGHTERFPKGVGLLIENGQEKALSSREACNKIIHALEANIEWEECKEHPVYEKIYQSKYGNFDQRYLSSITPS